MEQADALKHAILDACGDEPDNELLSRTFSRRPSPPPAVPQPHAPGNVTLCGTKGVYDLDGAVFPPLGPTAAPRATGRCAAWGRSVSAADVVVPLTLYCGQDTSLMRLRISCLNSAAARTSLHVSRPPTPCVGPVFKVQSPMARCIFNLYKWCVSKKRIVSISV